VTRFDSNWSYLPKEIPIPMRRLALAAAAAFAITTVGVAVSASPASAAATCTTITTTLPDRVDGGNHGDWAHDQMTRRVEICEAAGGYHATVADSGTFTTVAGSSPQAGVPLVAGVTGSVTGSFSADFTATGLVLSTLTSPAVGTGTSVWVQTIVGTAWTGGSSINNDWSWTYKADCETWTDSADNQDGELSTDGDITGKACPPAPVAPAPVPAVHPTTAKPGTTHAPAAGRAAVVAQVPGSPSAAPSDSPSPTLSATPSLTSSTSTGVAATPAATDGAISTRADTSHTDWYLVGGLLILLAPLGWAFVHFRRKQSDQQPRDINETAILPQHRTEQP
jgi:hypothetical protein